MISGPQVADAEEPSQEAEEAVSDAEQSEPAEQSEAEETVSRTDEEIAERTAEIERRQDQRRAAPVFEVSGPFPWEYPLIAVAGVFVLLSGALLVRVLTRPPA